VAKTSIEIDRDIAAQAAEILGTSSLKDTVDAALHEIVRAQKRRALIRMLAEPGRFDFEAAEHAWGGDE
jgi:Arc/MetJ family transcription regulator